MSEQSKNNGIFNNKPSGKKLKVSKVGTSSNINSILFI